MKLNDLCKEAVKVVKENKEVKLPEAPNALNNDLLTAAVCFFDTDKLKKIMTTAKSLSSISFASRHKIKPASATKDSYFEAVNNYFNEVSKTAIRSRGSMQEMIEKIMQHKNDPAEKFVSNLEKEYDGFEAELQHALIDAFISYFATRIYARNIGIDVEKEMEAAIDFGDASVKYGLAEGIKQASKIINAKEAKKPEVKESKLEKKEEDKPEAKATSESVKADEIPQPAMAAVNMGAETHNPTSVFRKFISPKQQPQPRPQAPSFNQFVSQPQPVAPVQQTPVQTQAAPQQKKKVIDNIQGKLADTAWAPNMFNTKSLAGHSIQEKAAAVKKYMRLIDGSHPGVEESRVDSLLYLISHTKLLRDAEKLGVKIPQPFRGFKFNEIALDTYMDEAIKASSQKSASKCDFAFRLNLKASDGGSVIVYYNTHQPKPGVTKAPTVFKVNGTEGFVMLGKKKHGAGCNCGNC